MKKTAPKDWMTRWLDGVAAGKFTMSARRITNVNKFGGLTLAKKLAQARQLHLLKLRDDTGRDLIVASKDAFKIIC